MKTHTSSLAAAAVLLGLFMTAPASASADGAALLTSPCTATVLPGLPDGSGNGEVLAIGSSGVLGGSAEDSQGTPHPTLWTQGPGGWTVQQVPVDLPNAEVYDINSSGLLLVASQDPWSAAVYDPATGSATVLPGLGGPAFGRRLNDAGEVAGFAFDSQGHVFPATWSPPYTKASRLPVVGAAQHWGFGEALGINSAGQTVGAASASTHVPDTSYWASTRQWHGVLRPLATPMSWGPTGAPTKLPTGYAQGIAWAVDDDGTIVGTADNPSVTTANYATIGSMPAYWRNGAYHDLSGGNGAIVYGTARNIRGGMTTGNVGLADGSEQPFVWTGSGAIQLLALPSGRTDGNAHGVSGTLREAGGDAYDGASSDVAVLWQCPAGFRTG